jgi:hypothetical protein
VKNLAKAKKTRRKRAKAWVRRRVPKKISLAVTAGVLGGLWNSKHPWAQEGDTTGYKILNGNWKGALIDMPGILTGVDYNGKFDLATVIRTYAPMAVGIIVHKVAGKVGLNRQVQRLPFVGKKIEI